ncbi:alpha/beta hydrolase [Paenibacillus sp. Leaf72]|uniref:alpha/beta hydrolase n=1 Tax=Paenibacillus sp. Leaf72 TaxID=1736234 RepID=UPI0006FACE86|nr:alpha/beta hydrolase [Paenibacillus sp. Leaf72]KQO05879.1 hypothetical protein ASF12_32805 [Paenibacillus sp. Leaf72]
MIRKYNEQDIIQLQNAHETVEQYGIEIVVKKSPGEDRAGYMDPWVIETMNPTALTREDGAITANTNDTLNAMMQQMSPDQLLIALRTMMKKEADGQINTFLEDRFEKDIDVQFEELELGGNKVGLWRYSVPGVKELRPAFFHIHGGGWFAGSPTPNDNVLRLIAEKADAVVFDIDYSLSPEFKFPNGLNDCYNALKHIYDNADTYGIDKTKIAVGGGSGGGNFTTVLALKARDEGLSLIALQVPIVPVVFCAKKGAPGYKWDPSQFYVAPETKKYVPEVKDPNNDTYMDIMINAYIGDADPTHPYISPMMAESFEGLPKALIITNEFDALRLQGEFYGSQLAKAGVPVRMIRYQGQTHSSNGGAAFGVVPQSEDLALEIINEIKQL